MTNNFLQTLPGWRYIDERNGLIFPWYTKPFLENILSIDTSNWKIFEYGCGDSTIWWKNYCDIIISVDNDLEWSQKTNSFFVEDKNEYINFPKKFISDGLFDCIIIDGDPVVWRDECTSVAIDCLKKGGLLIIDNYNQKTVNNEHMPISEKLLKNKEKKIYKQEDHEDWKTACWIM